ncbi:MAG: hypothetical protein Q9174_004086 [Haloplaca sp. 1 TL-2023]
MEPVTAFSLVAGVIQVVDISFKAVARCRELYKDGSLAEHQETREITNALLQASRELNDFLTGLSAPQAKDDVEVFALSKKCSTIANDILLELEKLKPDRQSLRQTVSKGFRTMMVSSILKDKQAKLERYQQALDTRILIRLDVRALRESKGFQSLGENVENLASAIECGHKTVAGLLSYQQREILDHLDRRFDDVLEKSNQHEILERFQDSLVFPEINSRQEQISEAFQGTCKWIFDPPCPEYRRGRTWPSFRKWLTLGKNIYWISGKPGSGKSTLMKYIINDPQTMHFLEQWEGGSRVISFFFWNTGSELQRSATGLLRSLIYQMTMEWPELVDPLINNDKLLRPRSLGKMMYAWTEQRLLTALKLFLKQKPSDVGLCVFIDGLDEFIGDEELLLDIVRSFSACPLCKVCVSSRPEQVFREEFAESPRIRVQDLNSRDIEHMVFKRLRPTFEQQFPGDNSVDSLMIALIEKAEGIFLWLSLMINDIVKGSKNGDTVEELRTRLHRAPDTINGMYAYMLGQLDQFYLDDAMKFFATLFAALYHGIGPWVLGLACTEDIVWKRILQSDFAYFNSPEFALTCAKCETRFLARCGGLVETFDETQDDEYQSDVERYQKSLRFIHRSAVDFLVMNYNEEIIQRRFMAAMDLVRANVGILSLCAVSRSLHPFFQKKVVSIFSCVRQYFGTLECMAMDLDASTPIARSQADLTAQALQILWSLHSAEDISRYIWPHHQLLPSRYAIDELSDICQPSHAQLFSRDPQYLAAFSGCVSYLKSSISSWGLSSEQLDNLLIFALAGLGNASLLLVDADRWGVWGHDTHARLLTIQLLLQHNFEPLGKTMPSRIDRIERRTSFFGVFLLIICRLCSLRPMSGAGDANVLAAVHAVVGAFLSSGTDVDTRIGGYLNLRIPNDDRTLAPTGLSTPLASFVLDMSPLVYLHMLPRKVGRYLSEVEARLSSAGARDRTRFRFVKNSALGYYRVSILQSQRLNDMLRCGFPYAVQGWDGPPDTYLYGDGELPFYDETENPEVHSYVQIVSEITRGQPISHEMMKEEWDFGGSEWAEEAELQVQEAKHQQYEALLDAVAFGRD